MKKHGKDPAWMHQAATAGFDVHHLDGERMNNDPENLIMIFTGDHAQIHNIKLFESKSFFGKRGKGKWMTKEELEEHKRSIEALGEKAYNLRLSGILWKEVEEQTTKSAMLNAKHYAKVNDLEWPIRLSDEAQQKIKEVKSTKIKEARARRQEELDKSFRPIPPLGR